MLHDILVQVDIVCFLVFYISFGLSRIFRYLCESTINLEGLDKFLYFKKVM